MGILNGYGDRGYTSEGLMDEHGEDWDLQKTERLRTEIFTCKGD